jgi:hypothetical protein
MPRQLFFKDPKVLKFQRAHPNASDIFALNGTDEIKRPAHLTKIAMCLTLWPYIDLQLALLLAALTHANAPPMIAVYSILRRATGRYEAIKAAAEQALDKRGQAIIAAIVSFVKTVEAQRNDIAHGHWGVSAILPEVILWISGPDTINVHVKEKRMIGHKEYDQINIDEKNYIFIVSKTLKK